MLGLQINKSKGRSAFFSALEDYFPDDAVHCGSLTVFYLVAGALCPGSTDPCLEKPCPGDMQCVGYEANRRPFICQCPPGKLGECSGAFTAITGDKLGQ
ncbi:hypothetical protein EK904_014893 [Melospiza melodia maxima]|nr:hypothetical protein EK904_014893 [Melospiza melodia maxima]